MDRQGFVYILASKRNATLYIGVTSPAFAGEQFRMCLASSLSHSPARSPTKTLISLFAAATWQSERNGPI